MIEPKLDIDRVFYLLGYSRDVRFHADQVAMAARGGIAEPFVLAFLETLQRAMRRGLPTSYVRREEALPTIRGRIRFADQIQRRQDLPLPVEVSYDDFTVDTEENRLVKAALRRAEHLRLRNPLLRRRAAELLTIFDGVQDANFNPRRLPAFTYNRLNQQFRPVLELAALLVQSVSLELHPGATSMSSILFNMNKVFEDFVWAAVGDALRKLLPPSYRWRHGRSVTLDEDSRLRPEPDLSLWHRSRCVFVGDAKYKETAQGEINDIYQLLAYCASTGLDEGLLLYAEKPGGPTIHEVVRGGPTLKVETVDVTAPVEELGSRCRTIAAQIAATATKASARPASSFALP